MLSRIGRAVRPCIACFGRRGCPWLCDLCRAELAGCAIQGTTDGTISLFVYRDVVRDLVLRVKVGSDHRALSFLIDTFVGHPAVTSAAARADAIVPCPSSLWGRIRGRLDLAALLADELGRAVRLPVLAAPVHLHWTWRKRARLDPAARPHESPLPEWVVGLGRRRFEEALARARPRHDRGSLRLLVIDDVTTTGGTLARTAAAISCPDGCVRTLTLAAAPRRVDGHGESYRSSDAHDASVL